jgi:hypothetical protein
VDNTFASITGSNAALIPKSQWQVKAHLRPAPTKKKEGLPPLFLLQPPTPPQPNNVDVVPPIIAQPPEPPLNFEFQLPPDDQVLLPPPPANEQEQQQQVPDVRRSGRERRSPAWHRDYVPIDRAIAMPTIIESSVDDFFNPASTGDLLLAYKAIRRNFDLLCRKKLTII